MGTTGVALGLASEIRLARPEQPLTDRWRTLPVDRGGPTLLGISFRPRQAESFGLDPIAALGTLLDYPFEIVRLGAYWDRMEPEPGRFDFSELDWQVEAAEAAGRQIILCVGPVKCFGYPECFIPDHVLDRSLPEHRIVSGRTHPSLLAASTAFVQRVVERYRRRAGVVAWQVEHEAVDPLGLEHSWRLATSFLRAEIDTVRGADPTRPVVLNGFLPTSTPVRLSQGWRTRGQGDSLAVAGRLADVIGIDYYPRHAVARLGPWRVYLDGGGRRGQPRRWRGLASRPAAPPRRVMITEGQAEPWEAETVPPDPVGTAMYSCRPEDVIGNYNRAARSARRAGVTGAAYLFWGAEYWLRRRSGGDARYLDAFARVLAERAHPPGDPRGWAR